MSVQQTLEMACHCLINHVEQQKFKTPLDAHKYYLYKQDELPMMLKGFLRFIQHTSNYLYIAIIKQNVTSENMKIVCEMYADSMKVKSGEDSMQRCTTKFDQMLVEKYDIEPLKHHFSADEKSHS